MLETILGHDTTMADVGPIHIMGAGLSGLAAATTLAKEGVEVHVHDVREDSGKRFDGDFQALENWSMEEDFFDQLVSWGYDPSEFKATEFNEVDLVHPDDVITQTKSPRIAYRIVERGTSDHTIDQGFKRMAIAAGANLHYKSRVKEEDCQIIACGPKGTSAVAYGEIFHTKHPNHIAFQLNDKLAPGAYSYLIIIDGVGLICTCLWRKQKGSDRFLNQTIAWYQEKYPGIDMAPIKRVGGKGDFTINKKYFQDGRYYVGESGGLQDFMWGFGMRMAVWSGHLAAQDILGNCNYEAEVRKKLMPYVRTSVTNRFLMNRVGNRTFKFMCKSWVRNQNKTGDGLIWIGKLFRPKWYKTMLYYMVSPFMLRNDPKSLGRGVRRLPFRKAKARDSWTQSEIAQKVGERWNEVRRSGGNTSFDETSD